MTTMISLILQKKTLIQYTSCQTQIKIRPILIFTWFLNGERWVLVHKAEAESTDEAKYLILFYLSLGLIQIDVTLDQSK